MYASIASIVTVNFQLGTTLGGLNSIFILIRHMAGYNRTRSVEQLLEKTESEQPSFTVHLHPEFWVLNNGSKFLYQNQIAVCVVPLPFILSCLNTRILSLYSMIYVDIVYRWTFLNCLTWPGYLFTMVIEYLVASR